MHELAITKNLIETIISECNEQKIIPRKIITDLGALTSYKKEPIMFYYDILKKEKKLLFDAKLEINFIKGRILCNSCNSETEIEEDIILLCPKCESTDIKIVEGKEFKLREILVW